MSSGDKNAGLKPTYAQYAAKRDIVLSTRTDIVLANLAVLVALPLARRLVSVLVETTIKLGSTLHPAAHSAPGYAAVV